MILCKKANNKEADQTAWIFYVFTVHQNTHLDVSGVQSVKSKAICAILKGPLNPQITRSISSIKQFL